MTTNANGKTVLITGASRGIGAATALRLAKRGDQVVLVARPGPDLEETARRIGEFAPTLAVGADITRPEDVDRAVAATLARFGRIDGLINNAALYVEKPFLECGLAEMDDLVAVDLRGAFLVTRAAAPHMIAGGGGSVVNLSSLVGLTGARNQAVHSACKAALLAFSDALLAELRSHGVRVSAICPGSTDTWGAPDPERHLRPDDVAAAVEFVLHAPPGVAVTRVWCEALGPRATGR